MSFPLKQSTASQEILLGPFVDDMDGKTAEIALTIANTDIKIWKSGGTTEASKNSGGATHIAGGRYYAVLDATDTDTLGAFELNVHVAGALPVQKRCIVYPSNVYDSLFGSDKLQVDVTEVAANALTAAALATDAVTEIQSGLATAASLTTVTGYIDTEVTSILAAVDTEVAAIKAKTDLIPASPAAVGSAMTLATDSVSAAALAADAVAEIQSGLATASVLSTVAGYLDTEIAAIKAKTDQLTFTTANKLDATIQAAGDFAQGAADKVWSSTVRTLSAFAFAVDISAAGLAAIWNRLTSAITTTGSIGKLIVDFLDAAVSSRMATFVYTAPPSLVAITDAVLDEDLTGHDAVGSVGAALSAASSAGDPWATLLPGAYGAGTAGYLIGTYVDAAVSSRLATGGYVAAPTVAQIRTEMDANSTKLANLDINVGSRLATAGYVVAPTAIQVRTEMDTNSTKLANLDTNVGSRMATFTYTAPSTAIQNADALLDRVDAIETGWTLREALRIQLSALGGNISGAGTMTVLVRNVLNTKTRITAPVDELGNRTGVTFDKT